MYRVVPFSLVISLTLAACDAQQPAAPAENLDSIAREFVKLSLTIGEKEVGYIDAYYGPADLQTEAKADAPKLTLQQLLARTEALRIKAEAASSAGEALDQRRAKFLAAQLKAAATRLRMMSGEKLSFQDEAEGLFGVRPPLQPMARFDPIIAEIDGLVPGPGPLPDRVEAFRNRFIIPAAKLKQVFDAAIAECKRRTLQHIALPKKEAFTLAFVTGKSWGGYNYYQGNSASKIEINTDLPSRISRAVDLGCHEGYPGHHVLNALLEQKLTRGRGWTEFSIYPLYSPQSLLAEGSANYGIELAFPGSEKLAFEKQILYPLAGLDASLADRLDRVEKALAKLGPATTSIAADLLDGRIDEPEALRRIQRYKLVSLDRAKKDVAFARQYRSYVINYGLGMDMVRADIERAGASPQARWKRMEQLLSEPTLPSDLTS